MEDGNLAILVDAKTEYTKQLVSIISPYIYTGIKAIYYEAKGECFERDEIENTLRTFQKRLSDIPKWNQEVIDDEYTNIITDSKCDWLEDLIMAVFVSHTRILTSINFNKSKNKVNLKIPKVDHFIHQCYIEVARCFWKNPYLFDDTINKYEFQRNRREAEQLIESQIHETIRRQLPVKNILREYLGTEYKDIDEPEDDVETDSNHNDNLRKLVKAEIENCSKEKLDKFNIEEEAPETAPETTHETAPETTPEETVPEETAPETAPEEKAHETTPEEKAPEEKALETASAPIKMKIKSKPPPYDDGALSDNEIEKNEVSDIIETEVEKLDMEPFDNGLNIEELNLDIDDLSLLEEVYQDSPPPSTIDLLKDPPSNIKLEEEEPPIKTIIIDTKRGSSKIVNNENDLEINDFEDDEGSDSEDESSRMKQKVYNKYSKTRDYSFFN
jgi:hypothetical protein